MASLLIATPFLHADALRRRAVITGSQGQKMSRVSCQAAGDQVTVRHTLSSPLLNLTPSDLIAAYFEEATLEEAIAVQQVPVAAAEAAPRRLGRVIFTEEKARRMRKENRATSTFHDKWYHSAIASRLATPE